MSVFFSPLPTEEYNTSIQEKLPLIIGSAAAGLVFLIAVVVIIIVCNRWVSPDTVFIKLLADVTSEQAFLFVEFLLSKLTRGRGFMNITLPRWKQFD